MNRLIILLSIFSLIVISCEPQKNKSEKIETSKEKEIVFAYNLNEPSQKFILPNKLSEISGLSYYSENMLVCINDELGIIYHYDLEKEEISKTIDFGKNGDYEGVEMVDGLTYVLNSTGKITVVNVEGEIIETIDCSLKQVSEYEGIGFEALTNSLLLAAKEERGEKKIYSYNLNDHSYQVKFTLPKSMIESNGTGKEFKPSGIAVNPQTGDIYVLASTGKKIMVLNNKGEKKTQYNLDSELFRQPEGICFSPEGDLFIASEGRGVKGYVLKFIPANILQ
ncbi:MAG: SdiA-regulated domain-containing protein [Bacteroidota bacterium]